MNTTNDPFAGDDILIEAKGISLTRGEKEILSGASLKVRRGEIVTLIGPNGAGKTSIVRVVLGLMDSDLGSVTRHPGLVIGYMPQRLHIDATLPLTVGRFMGLGARHKRYTAEQRLRVLDEVGVGEILDTPVQAVSGGEFQRVVLARALLRDPDLLVLDEPSQGIDMTGQAQLYQLITRIRDRRGCGVLMVSHDLHLVMADTDEVVCLNHHVCCAGHPEMVANDPAYIQLFGKQVAGALAVYHHHHDHDHDAHGNVVPHEHHDHADHGGHDHG
ncbi:MAG: zinc ABC transporter ATP-binding protein ZnuC [Alphaproteobacteria bacterium]|nr:zinc ABC transporter ATP-binding protein ZnuC [Alphaproteobacteria bacterium]MBT7942632.1 zinc ABC transporter ATP-binding protein ZnuC [Alphaproteobacteria bacterium]